MSKSVRLGFLYLVFWVVGYEVVILRNLVRGSRMLPIDMLVPHDIVFWLLALLAFGLGFFTARILSNCDNWPELTTSD
jgi:hypothetical protein